MFAFGLSADPAETVSAVTADYNTAMAMANNNTLWSTHVDAWVNELWSSRIELVG